MMKFMQMDYEELKNLSYEELVEAKTEVENTEPFDTNRFVIIVNALSEAEAKLGVKKEVSEPDTEVRYPHMKLIDLDAYARKYPVNADDKNILNRITHGMIEQSNKAVKERVTADYEEKIASLKAGFEEERTNWEFQNRKMQGELQEMEESTRKITEEKNKFKLDFEDIEPRFKALEQKYKDDMAEKDKEIEQLREKIKDLTDKTKVEPKEIEKTYTSEELNALIQKANEQQRIEEERKEAERLAARPKITNVRWKDDIKQKEYLAELVGDYPIGNDGQTIEFGRLDINRYQVMSQEEAGRFRAEAAATAEQSSEIHTDNVVPSDALVEIPEVQPVEDFRTEEVGHLEGLDAPGAGEVLPQTLEERVAELEKAVFGHVMTHTEKDVA